MTLDVASGAVGVSVHVQRGKPSRLTHTPPRHPFTDRFAAQDRGYSPMTQRDHGADLAGRQSGVLAEPFNVAGPAGPWGVLLSLAASHVAKLLSPAPPHWPRSHHDAATSALLSIKLDCHPHLPSRLARHGIVLFRTLLRHDVLPFHACICFLCWKLPGTNSEKSQISVRLRIRGHPSPGTGMGGVPGWPLSI